MTRISRCVASCLHFHVLARHLPIAFANASSAGSEDSMSTNLPALIGCGEAGLDL